MRLGVHTQDVVGIENGGQLLHHSFVYNPSMGANSVGRLLYLLCMSFDHDFVSQELWFSRTVGWSHAGKPWCIHHTCSYS